MVRHTGEDFVDVEGIAVASVLSFQSAGIDSSELDTPEADRLPADSDPPLCQYVLDVSVTQIEAVVQPDCVRDDVWRESVAFICIHSPILSISARKPVSTSILLIEDDPLIQACSMNSSNKTYTSPSLHPKRAD